MRRFPGSFISANTPSPSYGINTAAPGFWTRNQQRSYKLNYSWPQAQAQSFLWTWGLNSSGELGLGNTTNYSSPKQVGALSTWRILASAGSNTLSIKNDGTLWSFGSGQYGKSGWGNTSNYSSPKQVGSRTDWANIFPVGTSGLYALTKTGVVYRWGGKFNNSSQSLIPSTDMASPLGSEWASISIMSDHIVGLRKTGTLWTWGYGTGGKLGLGNTTNYSSPKQIGSRTDWKQIVNVGAKSVFGLTTDGSLWFWGQDMSGVSFYSGTQVSFTSPILISNEKWLKLGSSQVGSSSYANNILGIKNDGSLWIWGTNSSALVGYAFYGGPPAITSPILVDSSKNWFDAAVINYGLGNAAVAAIKTDGTLWTWGRNVEGQLGLNNTTNYSSPKQVGLATNWISLAPSAGSQTIAIRGI